MLSVFRTIFKYKEKESPDVLGLYPEHVHVPAIPERRYLWTSRVLVILASISICISMMIATTIYLLLPQKSAAPVLYKINPYFNELETVERAERNVFASDLIIEEHITRYILYRYTITRDYDELMNRWAKGGIIYWYSSDTVFNEFAENDVAQNIRMFRDLDVQRRVQIDWIRPLGRWLWQVQFRTNDYIPGYTTPATHIWRANMRIRFVDFKLIRRELALFNPFGFTVLNYSLGYQGVPGSSASYMEYIKARTLNNYRVIY